MRWTFGIHRPPEQEVGKLRDHIRELEDVIFKHHAVDVCAAAGFLAMTGLEEEFN